MIAAWRGRGLEEGAARAARFAPASCNSSCPYDRAIPYEGEARCVRARTFCAPRPQRRLWQRALGRCFFHLVRVLEHVLRPRATRDTSGVARRSNCEHSMHASPWSALRGPAWHGRLFLFVPGSFWHGLAPWRLPFAQPFIHQLHLVTAELVRRLRTARGTSRSVPCRSKAAGTQA